MLTQRQRCEMCGEVTLMFVFVPTANPARSVRVYTILYIMQIVFGSGML